MMTGTTDNGSWSKKLDGALERRFLEIPQSQQPAEAVGLANAAARTRERGGENLRKTARGASSPAKPALHIPELGYRSQLRCSPRACLVLLRAERGCGSKSRRITTTAASGGGAVRRGRGEGRDHLTHCR